MTEAEIKAHKKKLLLAVEKLKGTCPIEWNFILEDILSLARIGAIPHSMNDNIVLRETFRKESFYKLYERYTKENL